MPINRSRVVAILALTVALALGAVAAIAVGSPAQASTEPTNGTTTNGTTTGPEPVRGCQLAEPSEDQPLGQPEHPLEMNTVVVSGLIKTVIMEKEVFLCPNEVDEPTVIRDLETFIELVERKVNVTPNSSTPTYELRTVDMRVELAFCEKRFDEGAELSGTVRCGHRTVPLGPRLERELAGCTPLASPSDPVEMNTVAFEDWAKTIKVEKEFFDCPETSTRPAHIAEVYLITEIIERRKFVTGIGYTMRPTQKINEGIICRKDERAGMITRCNLIAITDP